MRVRDKMTPNPVTITPQTTIADALALMREGNFRRLPVLDKGKLVGIVTDRDLSEVSPSPATSLSVFELNYLLSRTKIGTIIKKQQVISISPDAYLEEAALIMRDHEIGAIPVVEEGKLVGIITESNIFDAFIEMMGSEIREPGWNWNWKTNPECWLRFLKSFGKTAAISHIWRCSIINQARPILCCS